MIYEWLDLVFLGGGSVSVFRVILWRQSGDMSAGGSESVWDK